MAKSENRLEAALANAPLDLDGVDLTRAKARVPGIVTLSHAVRSALGGIPRIANMTDDERASIAAWIERHVLGKAVNPNALVAACSAAINALTPSTATRPAPVTVTAGSGDLAMKIAVNIRKKRSAAIAKARMSIDKGAAPRKKKGAKKG